MVPHFGSSAPGPEIDIFFKLSRFVFFDNVGGLGSFMSILLSDAGEERSCYKYEVDLVCVERAKSVHRST